MDWLLAPLTESLREGNNGLSNDFIVLPDPGGAVHVVVVCRFVHMSVCQSVGHSVIPLVLFGILWDTF